MNESSLLQSVGLKGVARFGDLFRERSVCEGVDDDVVLFEDRTDLFGLVGIVGGK